MNVRKFLFLDKIEYKNNKELDVNRNSISKKETIVIIVL